MVLDAVYGLAQGRLDEAAKAHLGDIHHQLEELAQRIDNGLDQIGQLSDQALVFRLDLLERLVDRLDRFLAFALQRFLGLIGGLLDCLFQGLELLIDPLLRFFSLCLQVLR